MALVVNLVTCLRLVHSLKCRVVCADIWRSLVAHLFKEASHGELRPSALSCHSWLAWATSSRAKIQTS